MGTGIGTGIFIGGQVYRGSSSNSGELGHISLDPVGPKCFCGNRGCVELFSAPAAVVAAARAGLAKGKGAGLELRGVGVRQDYARICLAAERGHPLALAVISRAAEYLGYAAVSLINLLDLDLVVLTGPAFARVGAIFAEAVEREVATRSLARETRTVEIRLSGIADDIVPIGAAALLLHSEFAPSTMSLKNTSA